MTFETLYKENAGRMHNYALRRLMNGDYAADVVQETFLAAYINQATVLTHECPIAWLTLTAKRRIMYYNNKEKALVALEKDYPSAPVSAYWEWLPSNLSDIDQRIAHLLFEGNLRYSDIANEVGLSLAACQSRIKRLYKRIRIDIQNQGKEVEHG